MSNIKIFSVNFSNCDLTKLRTTKANKLIVIKPNYSVVSEIIHWQRSKKRVAFPHSLTKGNVNATGKKPFAQKGRGTARQGSLKSPHQIGGGVAFSNKGKRYIHKINKKKRLIALKSLLCIRIHEKRIKIIDRLCLEKPSTKKICDLLKYFSFNKTLFIDINNTNLRLSIKNLYDTKFLRFDGINTLDIIKFPYVLITRTAFKKIMECFFL